MRLRYMEMHNYRKFRDARIEFPDGVVAIVGPNGAGKTTILEAVTWALFGNASSVVRDSKEGVVSLGASPGDECSVVLEFDLGEDAYRLARTMKVRSLKVNASLEVNGRTLATGDSDVTEAMVSRLGMDHQAFFVSVFTKQKDLSALANLRPADRKTLVLRMLRVDRLDSSIKDIDQDARDAKRQAEQINAMLRDADGGDRIARLHEEERASLQALQAITASLERARQEWKAATARSLVTKEKWEAEEERYRLDVALERRRTGLQAALQAKHESLERLREEIAELERLRASLPELEGKEMEYQKAKAELERLSVQRERHLERRRREEELATRRRELESLLQEERDAMKELSTLPDTEASLATVEVNLEETRELISAISAQLKVAGAEVDRLRSDLETARQRSKGIAELGEDSNCPTCLRRMGSQYADLLRRYQEEVRSLEERLNGQLELASSLKEQMARGRQRREALEARRDKLLLQAKVRSSLEERVRKAQESYARASEQVLSLQNALTAMGTVDYDPAGHEAAKASLMALERSHLALNRARTKMERLPLAVAERERTEQAARKEEDELRRVEEERRALAFDMGTLISRREEHEKARTEEGMLAQEIVRAEGEQRRISAEIEAIRARAGELEGLRERYIAMMSEQETLNRLSQVMRGFKENVISRIAPTLSDVSSDLLSQLTEGKYNGMRLDEDYQMWIYDHGKEFRLERFSGGEVDLANLCLRLAISRMIMERSGSQMNFLVLDEIFGSQDQNRKRSILETLGQLQKQFRQILLITHIDDVKDNVTSVLRVEELENGCSTIVLED